MTEINIAIILIILQKMFQCISIKLHLRRRLKSRRIIKLGHDSELHNTNNTGDLYVELSKSKITNIEKS